MPIPWDFTFGNGSYLFSSLAPSLLSFVGDICGMEGKLYSSWLRVPWFQKHLQLITGTPNPLGAIYILSMEWALIFPSGFMWLQAVPRGSGPDLLSSFDKIWHISTSQAVETSAPFLNSSFTWISLPSVYPHRSFVHSANKHLQACTQTFRYWKPRGWRSIHKRN